jgi:hypothetical protein
MNPDRIYRQYRDAALAKQITASEYSTFVAMPFGDTFSYHSRAVLSDVIQTAAERANLKTTADRKFSQPTRVDDHAGTARVITEEITVQILESHLFIADLTFENAGVLLETGIALGLKPNPQIILITQGKLADLHFDIRNNTVISYNGKDAIDAIAEAMIAAGRSFERDADLYIISISQTLAPDAIACLKYYAEIQRQNIANALHSEVAPNLFPNDSRAQSRFELGTIQLLQARLIWTDWKVKALAGKDAFGMHATDLGWAVISYMWADLRKPRI